MIFYILNKYAYNWNNYVCVDVHNLHIIYVRTIYIIQIYSINYFHLMYSIIIGKRQKIVIFMQIIFVYYFGISRFREELIFLGNIFLCHQHLLFHASTWTNYNLPPLPLPQPTKFCTHLHYWQKWWKQHPFFLMTTTDTSP